MPKRSEAEGSVSRAVAQTRPTRGAGEVPLLTVRGRTLPEAWERAVVETWHHGAAVHTQYDKPDEPPSRDATVAIEVAEPLGEPRLHRSFPAGLEELEIYVQEVVWGVHDSWIRPDEGKWSYTYHQRLFAYDDPRASRAGAPPKAVDQVAAMVEELAACGYTRRAQAITWIPTVDLGHTEPPCLQRVWCRLVEDDAGVEAAPADPAGAGAPRLVMNTHWRSRDGYKAAFMNMVALTTLQAEIARRLGERLGRAVEVGRYVDISDSFHIYGSYFGEIESAFLALIERRSFEERTWRTADVADALLMGRVQLINGKPGEPPLAEAELARLYASLPESHRRLVEASVRERLARQHLA
jgi:thymidylate synthase